MKTSITSALATAFLAITISASTVSAKDSVKPATTSASAVDISSIQRVFISGNVEVTLLQDAKSKVLFTNESNAEVAVKKVGNSLYITSKNTNQTAKITVYVGDIYRIDASGNAVVQTKNTLNLKYLQVFLKDEAKADLSSKTESLYTNIKNESELTLKGSTGEHAMVMGQFSKITIEKFSAVKTELNNTAEFVASTK